MCCLYAIINGSWSTLLDLIQHISCFIMATSSLGRLGPASTKTGVLLFGPVLLLKVSRVYSNTVQKLHWKIAVVKPFLYIFVRVRSYFSFKLTLMSCSVECVMLAVILLASFWNEMENTWIKYSSLNFVTLWQKLWNCAGRLSMQSSQCVLLLNRVEKLYLQNSWREETMCWSRLVKAVKEHVIISW